MKSLFLLMLLLSLSNSAVALDHIQILTQKYPSATPYEILQRTFEESKNSISLQDIGGPSQHCAVVKSPTSDPQAVYLIRAKSNKLVEATSDISEVPTLGPLLPGKPKIPGVPSHKLTKEAVLPSSSLLLSSDQQYLWDIAYDGLTVSNDAQQLKATSLGYMNGISAEYSYITRKNGDLITFEVIHSFTPLMEDVPRLDDMFFGYCWNQ